MNIDTVEESLENGKKDIEYEINLEKIRKEVLKKFDEYKLTMKFLAADAPISILCLPKTTENILTSQGFLRVYDLFDTDFVKIKGLGEARIRNLTSCLDQFFSML